MMLRNLNNKAEIQYLSNISNLKRINITILLMLQY